MPTRLTSRSTESHSSRELFPYLFGPRVEIVKVTNSDNPIRSHMLDLSEESKEDNIADCVKYFTRMAKMGRKSPSRMGMHTNYFAETECRMARDGDWYHRW